jgi:lipoprotein NlpI
MILSGLWLYIVERKLDEKQAKEALKQRFEKSDKEQWGWNIVEFYLGNISEARANGTPQGRRNG